MPGLSGLALYGRLLGARNPIPTILITAYPDDDFKQRALNAGIVAYLVKPFSENDLLSAIQGVMKHKALLAPIKR